MAINLSKGSRINLEKTVPGLTEVGVGLSWDINDTDTGGAFDLDASVFIIDAKGKLPADDFFIFYNNLKSPDQAVEHLGDNLTGEGDGDDETVLVNLSKVDARIQEIVFVATIHDAEKRRQNFGQVNNAKIRLYNKVNNEEIAQYELDEDFSTETALEFGALYLKGGNWRFRAVGAGFAAGLQGFVNKYSG